MKNTVFAFACCLAVGIFAAACSSSKPSNNEIAFDAADVPVQAPSRIIGGAARTAAQPAAHIYKVNGRCADNVTAVIADGQLISYPAPSDISAATAPVSLDNGWWLDRQGIGPNTVFLKWTRAQYAALSAAPSPAEIKEAVIPGAMLQALYQLPMSASQAAADTAAVNRLIAEGLPGCKSLLPTVISE